LTLLTELFVRNSGVQYSSFGYDGMATWMGGNCERLVKCLQPIMEQKSFIFGT